LKNIVLSNKLFSLPLMRSEHKIKFADVLPCYTVISQDRQ